MKKALIVIDFINEIVHPDGKLAAKGYADYVEENDILAKTNEQIAAFRENDDEVIFVNVQFLKDYSDVPTHSPLFSRVQEFGVLQEGTWGTENIEGLDVQGDDLVFSKNTVSIFSGAGLYEYLKQNEIRDLYFAGCSTNLAIESSVRAAHDYNFSCHVCSSCCAAADLETHKNSLQNLSPLAKIL